VYQSEPVLQHVEQVIIRLQVPSIALDLSLRAGFTSYYEMLWEQAPLTDPSPSRPLLVGRRYATTPLESFR